MSKDYSEDQLIQKSAADLLENELGWTSVMAWDAEVLGTGYYWHRNCRRIYGPQLLYEHNRCTHVCLFYFRNMDKIYCYFHILYRIYNTSY